MSKKIIVTGGCGYIGSHTIADLVSNGYDPICIDNLSKSDGSALAGLTNITGREIKHYKTDLRDLQAVEEVFEQEKDVQGIIHFAAFKSVPESVKSPLRYFENNVNALVNLLKVVETHKIPHLVFSSSCSVYGNPDSLPVSEDTPMKTAESPYGYSKQVGERMINDFCLQPEASTKAVLLRYFNPVGAHQSGHIGENPFGEPENLVPRITGTALGEYDELKVFGSDYDTRDGTCIRDYIHVEDIAHAHTRALDYLFAQPKTECEIFNLGSEQGVSVLELIAAFEKVSGQKLNYRLAERREGDVVAVYSDSSKAQRDLGWKASRGIEQMMETAWKWATRT